MFQLFLVELQQSTPKLSRSFFLILQNQVKLLKRRKTDRNTVNFSKTHLLTMLIQGININDTDHTN